MIDSEIVEKLQKASIEERITLIELLLRSLKTDMQNASSRAEVSPQRPAFGFMKDTGEILGDVIASVLPENTWEVLR